MLLSYTIVDFDFYYNNGAVYMQMCTLLTGIQCKVSDTQVTVKACGPLVIYLQKTQNSYKVNKSQYHVSYGDNMLYLPHSTPTFKLKKDGERERERLYG